MNASTAGGAAAHGGLVARIAARLCERTLMPADRTAALLSCIRRFGGAALGPLPPGAPLRRPSMHLDGTPVQFSCSLGPSSSGGVRVAVEPGALTEPVSAQVSLSVRLLQETLTEWGWERCVGAVRSVAGAVLPDDPADMNTGWGGMWLGAVAHPRTMGLRAYFNLRFGDGLARWRRVGRVFAALSGTGLCPSVQEIVQAATGVARPVGLGLDLAGGRPHTLKVYVGLDEPTGDAISRLMPRCVGGPSRQALGAFLEQFGPTLPNQSVTCSYDVALDGAGTPGDYVRRFKVDVDASRALPSDGAAIEAAMETARASSLDPDDLRALLGVVGVPAGGTGDGGRSVQYIGLGLGESVANLNVYMRPTGLALAMRTGGEEPTWIK